MESKYIKFSEVRFLQLFYAIQKCSEFDPKSVLNLSEKFLFSTFDNPPFRVQTRYQLETGNSNVKLRECL